MHLGRALYSPFFIQGDARALIEDIFNDVFGATYRHQTVPLHALPSTVTVVATDLIITTLHQMGLYILAGHPVLLAGPEGCGKSSAVRAALYLSGALSDH